MGPGRSILRRVLIVGLLGVYARRGRVPRTGGRIEPPKRNRPGQARPLVTLLLKCPGPTVPEGRVWVKKVVTIEEPIPNGPSTAVKSELDLPEGRDGSAGPILGGHLDRIRNGPPTACRPQDRVQRHRATPEGGAEGSCDLRRSGRPARGMALAEADRLMARHTRMGPQDLDQGSAVLRWTTAGGTNGPSP